jgi:hypothetical protein
LDASSTLYYEKWKPHAVKWVDVLYWNLSVYTDKEGKFIWVKIDQQDLPALEKTIQSQKILTEEQKKLLIDWLRTWDVEAYFYKDPIGFDDRILFVKKEQIKEGVIQNLWDPIDVFNPKYTVNKVGIGGGFNKGREEKVVYSTTSSFNTKIDSNSWMWNSIIGDTGGSWWGASF